MDRFTSMQVFVCAVERGGFAPAASVFGISATMVSKHVRALEERLGARLLHRTTRRHSLTEAGRLYFERCKAILASVDDAESGVTELGSAPRGTLRVSAPVSFGAYRLAPALVDFRRSYPELRVELVLSDRRVDLIAEEFDAAVRIGKLADATFVARPLAPYRVWLAAAPDYLAKRGRPRTLAELARHECIGFSVGSRENTWTLLGKRGEQRVSLDVRLSINNGEALRQAALVGGGIILQPQILVADDVRAGRLERVLPTLEVPAHPMRVIYRPDRRPPAKLRAFVGFVVERFGSATPARAGIVQGVW